MGDLLLGASAGLLILSTMYFMGRNDGRDAERQAQVESAAKAATKASPYIQVKTSYGMLYLHHANVHGVWVGEDGEAQLMVDQPATYKITPEVAHITLIELKARQKD